MNSVRQRAALIHAVLGLVMVAALAACGGTSDSASTEDEGAGTTSSAVSESSAAATLSFSALNYSTAQASGSATLTVVRAGPATAAVSIQYATEDGTAVAGTDYTSSTGTLQWAENDSTPKTITVPVSQSTAFADTKSFQVLLSDSSDGAAIASPTTATVTIVGSAATSQGVLQLSGPYYAVDQAAGTATVTVDRLVGASGAVSVAYATSDDSATAGTNYTATQGVLQWADGDAASKSFTVAISTAKAFSGSKAFSIGLTDPLSGASIGTPGSAPVTITGAASASAGTLEFSSADYSVDQSTGSLTVTVERVSGSSGAVAVTYATSAGSAVAGTDFTATTGTLNWASGDTSPKTFTIPVSSVTPFSGNKTFTVALYNPTANATVSSPDAATVTITGSAAAAVGTVELSAPTYAVAQNAGTLTVTVARTGGSSGAATVSYATSNISAVAGTDYTAASGTLSWEEGDASSKSFTVAISNATPFSGSKSFNVTLATATGATLASPSSATVTITGDAAAAVGNLELSAATYSVAQSAGTLTVTVDRTGGSSGSIGVNYSTSSGTAVAGTDFTAASGTLTWAAGDETAKTFTVSISNATAFTGTKAFTVALSDPSNGSTLVTPSSATVTINGSGAATGATTWVYYDGVFNWAGDWSFAVTSVNYQDTTGVPLEGPYDIAIQSEQWGGWLPYINGSCDGNISLCFPTAPYTYIILSLKPTVANQTWQVYFLSANDTIDGIAANVASYGPTPEVGQWGTYKIPLSAFELSDTTILKFAVQDEAGLTSNLWYIDDVGFE